MLIQESGTREIFYDGFQSSLNTNWDYSGNWSITVSPSSPSPTDGGNFLASNQFTAETIVVHQYRWLKKLVSAITTLLVIFVMFKQYKVSIKDRIIVERGEWQT